MKFLRKVFDSVDAIIEIALFGVVVALFARFVVFIFNLI